MKKIFAISLLLIMVGFNYAYSVQYSDSVSVFSNAKQMYSESKFDSVVVILKTYLKKHGREQSTKYIVPLLMESLVRERQYSYFTKLLRIYRQKFPESEYLPRLAYLEGIVLVKQEQYANSIIAFSNAINRGISPTLKKATIKNISLICENSLTGEELGRIIHDKKSNLTPQIQEILSYYEFSRTDIEGHPSLAKNLAIQFRKNFPNSKYTAFAKDVIGRSKAVTKDLIPIALLAPISGYDAETGKSIVEAVQLAVDTYNEKHDPKVRLIIRDTKGSMIETANITHDIVENQGVSIIIGPCLSQNAIVTASMIIGKDVLMITPTATEDGIARLGKNIFQINITPSMLGQRIAKYAMENLNINEFVILSPLSNYGQILTDSFKKEVESSGAKIIAEKYFEEGENDFRMQFEEIREILAQKRKDEDLSKNTGYIESKKTQKMDSLYLADSTMSVGGFFIPAESEDVVMLVPQVFFYRIRTQLLGSAGWHNAKTITDGKRYVNNAIISTNFEVGGKSQEWQDFSNAYWAKFKTEPDRVVAPLGYDAITLLLNAINVTGNDNTEQLTAELTQINDYKGVSGLISLDTNTGVNTETSIVKIKDKKFIRLQ